MGDVSEPIRHSSGSRNRRKLLHNAECLQEELEFLHNDALKRVVNLQYALHRATTMLNRLKAEVLQDRDDE